MSGRTICCPIQEELVHWYPVLLRVGGAACHRTGCAAGERLNSKPAQVNHTDELERDEGILRMVSTAVKPNAAAQAQTSRPVTLPTTQHSPEQMLF